MRIEFHPEATRELDNSADWYLSNSVVAAKGFALAVDVALRKISDDPDRFPRTSRRAERLEFIGRKIGRTQPS